MRSLERVIALAGVAALAAVASAPTGLAGPQDGCSDPQVCAAQQTPADAPAGEQPPPTQPPNDQGEVRAPATEAINAAGRVEVAASVDGQGRASGRLDTGGVDGADAPGGRTDG